MNAPGPKGANKGWKARARAAVTATEDMEMPEVVLVGIRVDEPREEFARVELRRALLHGYSASDLNAAVAWFEPESRRGQLIRGTSDAWHRLLALAGKQGGVVVTARLAAASIEAKNVPVAASFGPRGESTDVAQILKEAARLRGALEYERNACVQSRLCTCRVLLSREHSHRYASMAQALIHVTCVGGRATKPGVNCAGMTAERAGMGCVCSAFIPLEGRMYALGERIASRRNSQVWSCSSVCDGRRDFSALACKLVACREDQVMNLISEVRVHAQMRHPRVVTLLDAIPFSLHGSGRNRLPFLGEPEPRHQGPHTQHSPNESGFLGRDHVWCVALVMEKANGGDLWSVLEHRCAGPRAVPFRESDARKILRHCLEGLEYLHALGIVHCDVKPSNILCSAVEPSSHQFMCKLVDFGLSMSTPEMKVPLPTEHSASCAEPNISHFRGTPRYAAPEIIRDGGHPTGKVDIWSCGVVLFLLLRGTFPFHGSNRAEIFHDILHHVPERLDTPDASHKTFSPEAGALLARLLLKSAEYRLSATQALRHTWFSVDEAILSENILEFDWKSARRSRA
ncbi:Serine/threonine-protein kinase 17A [Porphyridium purpureum]|uniref:Serine/threonine-protein kinase 17A n=1 Tax=Porphyridium purpureum TaxID=35688 RepID=A0A5J4Z400_PORPP|nr:Serine/threonine-protein kinase 17A [Porphyridium purpureum]|eukprot:POR0836..scf295_1